MQLLMQEVKMDILYGVDRETLELEELIPINGVDCSYKDLEELKKVVPSLNKTVNLATPYITQVVRHWYRNQYFKMEGNELVKESYQLLKEKSEELGINFVGNVEGRDAFS